MNSTTRKAALALVGIVVLGFGTATVAGAHPTDLVRDPVSAVGHVGDHWGWHDGWGDHQHGDHRESHPASERPHASDHPHWSEPPGSSHHGPSGHRGPSGHHSPFDSAGPQDSRHCASGQQGGPPR